MSDARRQEIERGIAVLARQGVTWSEWARARGFPDGTVRRVLRGAGPCVRGESFRVAERILLEAGARGGSRSLRDALEACEQVLSGCLEAELEDLRENLQIDSCAVRTDSEKITVICTAWDRGEALDRAARLNRALCQAREALGSAAGSEPALPGDGETPA